MGRRRKKICVYPLCTEEVFEKGYCRHHLGKMQKVENLTKLKRQMERFNMKTTGSKELDKKIELL